MPIKTLKNIILILNIKYDKIKQNKRGKNIWKNKY